MNSTNIKTLGELKKSGYQSKTIKEEVRRNLIRNYRIRKVLFLVSLDMKIPLSLMLKEHCSHATIYYFLVYADRQKHAWPARWWTCSMNISLLFREAK